MQGLRVITPSTIGNTVALGGGSGNFVQVISAQGLLTFVDNKNEFFYAYAGWQGVVKDFVSLKVSSTVASDIVIANVGKKVVAKDGLIQEFAQISKVSPALNPTQVANIFNNGVFGPFEGDGTNLFARPNEFTAAGSFPVANDTTLNFAGTALDGIQYMLLQTDATVVGGDSGTIQGILKSGQKVTAFVRELVNGNVVNTIGTTNQSVKINVQGYESLFIPKGTLAGTSGNFNLFYRAGFFAPQLSFQ